MQPNDMNAADRRLPDDPLVFIQTCIRKRQIFWTYHVNMRLQRRHMTRKVILDAVDTYELVEAYPRDKYLPSYLVLAHDGGEVFHVLFATDLEEQNVRVVTAYRPGSDEWENDGKTRRIRP